MIVTDTFPCGICHKNILHHAKSIYCDPCQFWVHAKCNNISNSEFKERQKQPDDMPWFCLKCARIMCTFGQLDNNELRNLYDFDIASFVDSMPSFEIVSGLSHLPNLDDYDIDEHLPSNVNSSYYSLQELLALSSSVKYFSLFYINIRSLSPHFDELVSTLAALKINFVVIMSLACLKLETLLNMQ